MDLLRFFFLIVANFLGLYGILLGVCLLTLHLVTIRSYGVPYLLPVAPIEWRGWKNFILRFSLQKNPSGQIDKRVLDDVQLNDEEA